MDNIKVASELLKLAKELVGISNYQRNMSYPFPSPATKQQQRQEGSSPFELALKKAIDDKIRELKRDGTVSMDIRNLQQVVRPPSASLEGAPRGTNAQYYYAEIFRNLCKGNKFVFDKYGPHGGPASDEGWED